MVDVKYERDLKRFIPLSELKSLHLKHKSEKNSNNRQLAELSLFTRSRLSVQPIRDFEWEYIVNLENEQV
jgi:predicted RNA-binding protein with PUA-like domain